MKQGFDQAIGKKFMPLLKRDWLPPLEPCEKTVRGNLAAPATKIHVRIYEKRGHEDNRKNHGNPILLNEVRGVPLGPKDHQKQTKDPDALEGNI